MLKKQIKQTKHRTMTTPQAFANGEYRYFITLLFSCHDIDQKDIESVSHDIIHLFTNMCLFSAVSFCLFHLSINLLFIQNSSKFLTLMDRLLLYHMPIWETTMMFSRPGSFSTTTTGIKVNTQGKILHHHRHHRHLVRHLFGRTGC